MDKNPLSHRAQEDERQTKLLKEAWEESGNIYGYRKLHHGLCDLGETCVCKTFFICQLAAPMFAS